MGKFEKGDRVRIRKSVALSGKYGSFRGEEGEITDCARYGNGDIMVTLDSGKRLTYVGAAVLEHVRSNNNNKNLTNDTNDITRESLEERKNKLEKALKRVNTKLEFLDATDSNIFSEKLFRAHQIVRLASSTEVDEKERAELIAEFL